MPSGAVGAFGTGLTKQLANFVKAFSGGGIFGRIHEPEMIEHRHPIVVVDLRIGPSGEEHCNALDIVRLNGLEKFVRHGSSYLSAMGCPSGVCRIDLPLRFVE